MRRFLGLFPFVCLLLMACGGSEDTDVTGEDAVVVADEGGVDTTVADTGATDDVSTGPLVGSCLAHITTQCVQYELPDGAPTGEFDISRTWCTGPKVWSDAPCPTEGLLGTCTVPPTDGAGYMTTKYLYYSEALLAGAQTTCTGYGNATWTTP